MDSCKEDQNPTLGRRKIGEVLIEAGLIDDGLLNQALQIQKKKKKKLGQILIEMGVADDVDIAKALASVLRLPFVRLEHVEIPERIVSLVPAEFAENYVVIPVKEDHEALVVAMTNPMDFCARDDLRFITQMPIDIVVAPQTDVLDAIATYYPKPELEEQLTFGTELDEAIEFVATPKEEQRADEEDLFALTETAPIVRFVNNLFADAIRQRASDIHIEPQKAAVIVRYRIDGVMREVLQTDKRLSPSIVSRIKILSNMDISIRRKPQDGRSRMLYGGKYYDFRVSSIPISYGEKLTIRILNPDMARFQVQDLGIPEHEFKDFVSILKRPQGIVLVTGPTGSGKSTALYACLNYLNTPEVNIFTVEDPVEYEMRGINQVQINPLAGITFAAGLRSILRQDPDIVMVGEIRDQETATIACQAAQTGHMVFSTLHTNDAPSAVTRLNDLGIEEFLITDSLIMVVGQRLVRMICEDCKKINPLTPDIVEQLSAFVGEKEEVTFWKGEGCESCDYTGYSGRLAIFEILKITPDIKDAITANCNALALKRRAEKQGFRSLFMDGIDKALKGLTTIEEVFRVAPPELDEGAEWCEVPQPLEETERGEQNVAPVSTVKPKRVLIVDDDAVNTNFLINILASENYAVKKLEKGDIAFKFCVEEKPDIVVADISSSRINGLSLIRKVRNNLSTRYIPIIALAARVEGDDDLQGLEAGADHCLSKPVDSRRLVAVLNRLFSRSDA